MCVAPWLSSSNQNTEVARMTNESIHSLSRQKCTHTVVESYQQWPEMGYECASTVQSFYQVCNTQESGVVKCVAKKRKYYVLIEPRHNRHCCGHRIHSVCMFCMQHYSKYCLVPRSHKHSAWAENRKYRAGKEVLQWLCIFTSFYWNTVCGLSSGNTTSCGIQHKPEFEDQCIRMTKSGRAINVNCTGLP